MRARMSACMGQAATCARIDRQSRPTPACKQAGRRMDPQVVLSVCLSVPRACGAPEEPGPRPQTDRTPLVDGGAVEDAAGVDVGAAAAAAAGRRAWHRQNHSPRLDRLHQPPVGSGGGVGVQ
jgi:hypothetical protein